ncbi:Lnb N-terminal periplasmic domain-containing protein [Luteolibacter soli]|uniref:Lnb N-terminal periplasmic domain-containing protein n=1 Tax=Luteolibacter soli TaxID=3135280 RepID=UPI0031193C2B
METPSTSSRHRSGPVKVLCFIGRNLLRLLMLIPALWCFGAIYFDGPFPGSGNMILGILWVALTVFLLFRARSKRDRWLSFAAGLAIVIIPWSFKKPRNDRDWSPEYARTANAKVEGDAVTFTNFRNFGYTLDGTVTERWETRTVHLSKLRGIDFFLNYWGSPSIAHPIFSFDFGDEGQVAFSIETRREKGETYTALGGLYKLYELTYLVGDERDFIRVRTNIREGEDAYLFRLATPPDKARERFLEYVTQIQALAAKPRFYNVLTANCTTAIRSQLNVEKKFIPDKRLIINGKLDELFAERGLFAVKDMPLPELKERGHVDDRAMHAQDDPEFSKKIRETVPGYDP